MPRKNLSKQIPLSSGLEMVGTFAASIAAALASLDSFLFFLEGCRALGINSGDAGAAFLKNGVHFSRQMQQKNVYVLDLSYINTD